MIKKHILHFTFTIIFLLCKTGYTDTSFRNIYAYVGDNVTLPDAHWQKAVTSYFKGEWYSLQYNCPKKYYRDGYCELCQTLYPITHTTTTITVHQLLDNNEQPLSYTCNTTGLYLYHVTTYTPSLYRLIHEDYSNKETTYDYFLNVTPKAHIQPTTFTEYTKTTTYITTPTSSTPHSNELASTAFNASFSHLQSFPHTRPIVVTVIIVTLLAAFSLYMYSHYKHRTML
ncbi:RL11 Family [Baboon cytomegalovirus]|nr:RL11 Family [Baboon cytomegalovirus]